MLQPTPQPAPRQLPHELRALLLSASLGGGHQKAGEALTQALGELVPGFDALHADYLKYLTGIERTLSAGVYMAWLKYSPASYRFFYDWTNKDSEPGIITAPFAWSGYRHLKRDLLRVRPQLVISSYTAPATLSGVVRARQKLTFLNALLVTDYSAHRHWARPEADLFMVATPAVRDDLIGHGIAAERIHVTGIPILPRYRALIGADRAALRARFGLDPHDPVALVSAGAAESVYKGLDEVTAALSEIGTRVQVLLLAGNGPLGVERIGGATIHRIGYTQNFPELLAASDVVVGKAGGLTVSEAMALGVPMVIYEPIPGQEEGNALYLESHGAALWAQDRWALRRDLLTVLGDPHRRAAMSAAARTLGRPDAAYVAARVLIDHLPEDLNG